MRLSRNFPLLSILIVCTLYVQAQNVTFFKHFQSNSLFTVENLACSNEEERSLYLGGNFRSSLFIDQLNWTSVGQSDVVILKTDGQGQIEWGRQGGGSRNDRLSAMVLDSEERLTVAGDFFLNIEFDSLRLSSNLSSQGIFFMQFDEFGNINWAQTIDGAGAKTINEVVIDTSNNIYAIGSFQGELVIGDTILIANSEQDYYLLKFNNSGNLIWARQGGLIGISEAITLVLDEMQNIFVAGNFQGAIELAGEFIQTSTSDSDVFTAAYTTQGEELWLRRLGGVEMDEAKACLIQANELLVLGNFIGVLRSESNQEVQSAGFAEDIFFARYNQAGDLLALTAWRDVGLEQLSTAQIIEEKLLLGGQFVEELRQGDFVLSGNEAALNGFLAQADGSSTIEWAIPLTASSDVILGDLTSATPAFVVGNFNGTINVNGFEAQSSVFNPFLAQLDLPLSSQVNYTNSEPSLFELYISGDWILLESTWNNFRFELYDSSGKRQLSVKNKTKIAISQLVSGVYFGVFSTRTSKQVRKFFVD